MGEQTAANRSERGPDTLVHSCWEGTRGWPWRTGLGSPGRVKYVSPYQPHGRSCPEMQLRPETQTYMPGGCLDHVAYLHHRAGQSGGRGVYCSGLGSPVTPALDAGVLVVMAGSTVKISTHEQAQGQNHKPKQRIQKKSLTKPGAPDENVRHNRSAGRSLHEATRIHGRPRRTSLLTEEN